MFLNLAQPDSPGELAPGGRGEARGGGPRADGGRPRLRRPYKTQIATSRIMHNKSSNATKLVLSFNSRFAFILANGSVFVVYPAGVAAELFADACAVVGLELAAPSPDGTGVAAACGSRGPSVIISIELARY